MGGGLEDSTALLSGMTTADHQSAMAGSEVSLWTVWVEVLPHSVVAHGWIPFLVVTLLALLASVLYVLWYRSDRPSDKAPGASLVSILGLFVTLVSALLVPVDIFLTSFMKTSDGSWKPWADQPEVRQSLESSILYTYYGCYGAILAFCFLFIPGTFFYHGPAEETSAGDRLCHATKFTALSIFGFSLLVVAGIFLPFEGSPPSNTTDWQKFVWFFDELEANHGQDLLLFLLNSLNIIGVCLLVVYTGTGLSALPSTLLRRGTGARARRGSVQRQLAQLEASVAEITNRYELTGETIPRFEQSQVERLEQQIRLLRREERELEQLARSLVSRCGALLRPAQLGIGLLLACCGFTVFLTLLLTCTDRALHSGGPTSGYTVQNSSLPNPLDLLLVAAQTVFPLDYILYTGIVLFLLAAALAGVRQLGIRLCCVSLYRVRAWRTPPRGLLLSILSLMLVILGQSVMMLTLVPDYTLYGSQHYRTNNTVLRCRAGDPGLEAEDCVPSRIAVLLFTFHHQAWIFGAAYYWLAWALLASILAGSLFSLYRLWRPAPAEDEEELLDSDGEEERYPPSHNPFD